MASGTKQRICGAALALFNERGYAEVSLRDVAAGAGIAIGSLTYHFAKKDDLLAWMLADLHSGFEGMLDDALEGAELLGHLLCLFAAARDNQARYPFYFENIDSIMRESEALRDENAEFERKLAGYYERAFARLADEGILALGSAGSARSLSVAMVALHAGWATAASPASNGAAGGVSVDAALAGLLGCVVAPAWRERYDGMLAGCGTAAE